MAERKRVAVIGCGRWGSLIAWYLDRLGHEVCLYGRESSAAFARFKEELNALFVRSQKAEF